MTLLTSWQSRHFLLKPPQVAEACCFVFVGVIIENWKSMYVSISQVPKLLTWTEAPCCSLMVVGHLGKKAVWSYMGWQAQSLVWLNGCEAKVANEKYIQSLARILWLAFSFLKCHSIFTCKDGLLLLLSYFMWILVFGQSFPNTSSKLVLLSN